MGALLHVGAAFLGHAHQYDRIFRWHDVGANHGQVFTDQCATTLVWLCPSLGSRFSSNCSYSRLRDLQAELLMRIGSTEDCSAQLCVSSCS